MAARTSTCAPLRSMPGPSTGAPSTRVVVRRRMVAFERTHRSATGSRAGPLVVPDSSTTMHANRPAVDRREDRAAMPCRAATVWHAAMARVSPAGCASLQALSAICSTRTVAARTRYARSTGWMALDASSETTAFHPSSAKKRSTMRATATRNAAARHASTVHAARVLQGAEADRKFDPSHCFRLPFSPAWRVVRINGALGFVPNPCHRSSGGSSAPFGAASSCQAALSSTVAGLNGPSGPRSERRHRSRAHLRCSGSPRRGSSVAAVGPERAAGAARAWSHGSCAVLRAQVCRGTRSSYRGGDHEPKSKSPCGGPLAGRMGSSW
jgi:hypothetical protein